MQIDRKRHPKRPKLSHTLNWFGRHVTIRTTKPERYIEDKINLETVGMKFEQN